MAGPYGAASSELVRTCANNEVLMAAMDEQWGASSLSTIAWQPCNRVASNEALRRTGSASR